MFGKKLSEYIHYDRWILIFVVAVFLVRLTLPMTGVSLPITRWASINIVLLIGLIYCSITVHTSHFGSYKELYGLLLVQTAFAHFLIAFGILMSILTSTDNIYTAPEFFGGNNGRTWSHVFAHILGAFILPVFYWLIGSAILFVTKKAKR